MNKEIKNKRFDHPTDNETSKEKLLKMNMTHQHISDFFFENVAISKLDDVLEIGSGGGYNAFQLSKRAKNVVAIDISKNACEVTKEYNDERGITNLEVLNLAIEETNFNEYSFSIITAFSTIYFWSDLNLSLKKIYKYLKNGGRFYIMIATCKDDWQKQWKDVPNFKAINEFLLIKQLNDVGFDEISIKYQHQPNTKRLMIMGKKNGN